MAHMTVITWVTTTFDVYRLRARTDYKPVGTQGVYDLIDLLKKLPNLGELRCIILATYLASYQH